MKVYKVGFVWKKMRGLKVLVVLFLVVFAVNLASAQACDGFPGQIIFKISDLENAHAEERDGTAYNEVICFNDFFDGEYDGSAGSSINKVIGLSRTTNAHLEAPNESNYGVEVVYGDLECKVFLNNPGCNTFDPLGQGSVRIGSLSSSVNAHFLRLEVSNDYPYHLCCGSNTPPNPETFDCGNGVIDAGEECEPGVLGGYTCDDFEGQVGTLGCHPASDPLLGCQFDEEDSCSTPTLFCTDYGIVGGSHSIEVGTPPPTAKEPTSCGDYNDIEITPIGYGDTLEAFKEEMCGQCSVMIATSTLCAGIDNCVSPSCFWDGNSCELEYRTQGGDVCIVREVPDSDLGCEEGQAFKNVKYTDTCDPQCQTLDGCTRTIPCPKVVQLPFFDRIGFVMALVMVGLIYLSYAIVKKRK